MTEVIIAVSALASPTPGNGAGWGAVLIARKDGLEIARKILSGTANSVPAGLVKAVLSGLDAIKKDNVRVVITSLDRYTAWVVNNDTTPRAHAAEIAEVRKRAREHAVEFVENADDYALLLAYEIARNAAL